MRRFPHIIRNGKYRMCVRECAVSSQKSEGYKYIGLSLFGALRAILSDYFSAFSSKSWSFWSNSAFVRGADEDAP